MARVKITDLPIDQKISKEELKNVRGGGKVAIRVSTQAIMTAGPPAGGGPVPMPYPKVGGATGGKGKGRGKSTVSPSSGDEPGTGGGTRGGLVPKQYM